MPASLWRTRGSRPERRAACVGLPDAAVEGAGAPLGLVLVPAGVGELVAQHVVDVDAVDVEPALLRALARGQDRALALLLGSGVLLNQRVGPSAVLGVGLDVHRE